MTPNNHETNAPASPTAIEDNTNSSTGDSGKPAQSAPLKISDDSRDDGHTCTGEYHDHAFESRPSRCLACQAKVADDSKFDGY